MTWVTILTDRYNYMGLMQHSLHFVDHISVTGDLKYYHFKHIGRDWELSWYECGEIKNEQECRSSYCECEEGRCSGGKVDMRAEEAEKVKTKDMVNSPSHYALFDDIEAIQVIASSMTKEMFKGYCFGNLLKYKLRAGGKDDIQQELKKAERYKGLYEEYQHLCKQN